MTTVKEDAGVHEEVCDDGEGRRWRATRRCMMTVKEDTGVHEEVCDDGEGRRWRPR